jgi:hypothetical protein
MTAEFLTFNFALQGEDTAARVDNPKGSQQFLGYCYIERDSNCYANSHRAECEKQKGVWSKAKPENCKGISDYGMGCENDACKDCGSRKHGETWCEYDGITGNGLDYVGARHYQRSCFDGKVYHEECRDYREEICVQDTKKAQCRVNRWEDCVLQSDADSCTDSEKRDCKWDYSLKKSYVGFYESKRCYPIVPPGFKHWQNNGWLVCQMANEQNDCDGAVCPAVWVDSSARYCYSMGDCGGYRNIADEVSKGGYINTQGPPRDYVYLSPGLSDEGQDYVLNLNTGSTKREPLDNPYENPHDNLNEVLRRVSEYTDETSSWSKDDFIWQYIWEGEIDYWVRHTAFCGMWQAPSGGQCNLCHADKNKPCTEYRCKSLGSACIYEEVDGYGRCFNEHRNDHTAPRIDLDQTKLTKNYTSEKDYLAGYNGWKVSPGVYPHTIVRFGIKTSEDTQCKISMLPGLNYTAITWPTGNFSQEHEIIYRMPDTNQIIGYFKDSTKLLSLIQMSKLDEINSLIEKIKRDAQETAEEFDVDASAFIAKISEVQEKFNGEVRPSISAFLDTMQNAISNLMAEIEARRHVVFIKCIDRAGNQNEQDVFVKFDVNEDTVPPAISDVQKILAGDHAQVRFSVNEDAECRYSLNEDKQFDEMRDTFECMSRFDSSVMFYYTCFAEVPAAAQKTTLYVKCKDKPAKTKNYALQLTSGMNTSVISTKYPNLVLINDSFINVTNDYALLSNDTKISSTYAKMRLGINFDISVACGLGNETMKQVEKYPEQMTCTKGYCEKELDIYERTVYIGCVNKAISQRVINDESIVIEIKPD